MKDINTKAKAIHKRLGDILDNEDNLMFSQQMEIQECMSMAREIFETTDKMINKPVAVTGCA
jgi:hypothetical protein